MLLAQASSAALPVFVNHSCTALVSRTSGSPRDQLTLCGPLLILNCFLLSHGGTATGLGTTGSKGGVGTVVGRDPGLVFTVPGGRPGFGLGSKNAVMLPKPNVARWSSVNGFSGGAMAATSSRPPHGLNLRRRINGHPRRGFFFSSAAQRRLFI